MRPSYSETAVSGDLPTPPWTAIQTVMLPRDANPLPSVAPGAAVYNTIFGGVILSNIDMAGAIGARHEVVLRGGNPRALFVTVALNRVEFKKPVLVGDVVTFQTSVTRFGRTSVTVQINVLAERGAETVHVTEAEAVFVAIDPDGPDRRPVPLFPPAPG
jgi:acyl-CoA thioesterase YciA